MTQPIGAKTAKATQMKTRYVLFYLVDTWIAVATRFRGVSDGQAAGAGG
jgi:hypothetical protein